jgi:hypothetical protein
MAAGQDLKRFLAARGWGRRHVPCGSLVALPRGSLSSPIRSETGAPVRRIRSGQCEQSRPPKALFNALFSSATRGLATGCRAGGFSFGGVGASGR